MELRDSTSTVLPYRGAGPLPVAAPQSDRFCDWVLRTVDAHRRWLFVSLFLIYLAGFNGQWRIERDSALYLAIGRNLAEGHGYTFRDQPHRLVFPGLPLMFAGTFRLFHSKSPVPPLLPALVLMWLMGLAALGLTYRLFYLFAGRPMAVMMTVGVGMTRLFYRYCFELLSDLPFFLGVMAFLAGYEALFNAPHRKENPAPRGRGRWYDWVLLLVGLALAVAMRPAMVALLVAIVLALAWQAIRGKSSLLQVGITLAIIGAAVFAFHSYDPRHDANGGEGDYEGYIFKSVQHLGPLLHQIRANVYELFEATLIKALFGISLRKGINTFFGVIVLALGLSLFRVRVLWGLWVAMTIAMLLLFKPVDRYFLPVIPLLVFAWWQLQVWLNKRLPLHVGNLLFLFLFLAGIGTNMSRIGELVVEQRRVPFLDHYRESRYESARKVSKLIQHNTGSGDCIVAEPKVGRVMTFLAHRDVFESTDSIPLPPGRPVFALLGNSFEEPRQPVDDAADPVMQWLKEHNFHLGAAVGEPVRGRHEDTAWMLYPALPNP